MSNSHTQTQIFRTAFRLSSVIASSVTKMPRDFKMLYGPEFKEQTLGILLDIKFANDARNAEKVPHLDRLLIRIEKLNNLVHLSEDLGHMKRPAFSAAVEHSGSVGRQAGGLRKKYAPVA